VQQCPFENVVNDKLFEKLMKKFNALYKTELDVVKASPEDYLDDEFRDVYQRIGVEIPEDGEMRKSRKHGKRRAMESDQEDHDEDVDEEADEEGQAGEQLNEIREDDELTQNGYVIYGVWSPVLMPV